MRSLLILPALIFALVIKAEGPALHLVGSTVTPHFLAESMRYSRDPEAATGARVQLFLRNDSSTNAAPLTLDGSLRTTLNGKAPADLLKDGRLGWHDFPAAMPAESLALPPGAITVWTFNSRKEDLGTGATVQLEAGPEQAPILREALALEKPTAWISTVAFFAPEGALQPDRMLVHLANESPTPLTIRECRLWLPQDPKTPRAFLPQAPLTGLKPFNGHAEVPSGEHGGFEVGTGPLPLTYTVIELTLTTPSGETRTLWSHLRIRPETFDISGGWVKPVTSEIYLKTLKLFYVNTAHRQITPGYSDTPLYDKYPLKYFGCMQPLEAYDTDAMLPKVHAVECLGEPQYGGGKPVPPQEVWEKLHAYAGSRLATTVTHSEERVWRDYAGACDFPHFDAYRVTAPSADAWYKYDRWGGKHIGWGAPLETIGDMCRSMRELNRPLPCAIWSQGASDGWGMYASRRRRAPTPDEIRLQAYHALSTRITSLYWFNLNLNSLVEWRDTLDEMRRIGREIRLLDALMLEGDAASFARVRQGDKLDWDLATIAGPRAALFFALDLDYTADPNQRVFTFGPPRDSTWEFPVPAYLAGIQDVFRIDADGMHPAQWTQQGNTIEIQETANRALTYVATPDPALRAQLEARRAALVAGEEALGFDPIHNDADFAALVELNKVKKDGD